ncbi:MAG: DNA processing protein [Parcubacteria group bacterium Gr01-1014_33]|nr:MAG: DNA processing protein [Parcubacteria group bacterium Gr01-1014_33]
MDARDVKFLNAFLHIPGIGGETLRVLKKHFGAFEAAWRTPDTAIAALEISPAHIQKICEDRSRIDPDQLLRQLIHEHIWIVTEEDNEYPRVLTEIPYPPFALYGQGNHFLQELIASASCALGVVGTRRATRYGLEVAEKLVQELVGAHAVIISGLATGIDTKAHTTTLDNKGKTIAVLGSGIDRPSLFPSENIRLKDKIAASQGAVISEHPPGTHARKEFFPQRNRIISGLARGVVVVEAREKSGALITARFALEQNREVFAVPGSILSPTSLGTHKLIQEGAKLVTSAEDILQELGIEYKKESRAKNHAELDPRQSFLLALLEEPVSVDMIKEKTGFDTPYIITSLSLLELKGLIKNMGGDVYQKI